MTNVCWYNVNTVYEKIAIFQKFSEKMGVISHFFKISPVSDLVENSYIPLSASALNLLWYRRSCSPWKIPLYA